MSKLYPPSIEGKLPAFAGDTLKVPLMMNKAVSMMEVKSMKALIKTVQTGTLKATLDGSLSFDKITGRYWAVFDLGSFKPQLGLYYKVQLAYVDRQNEVGYYSSIGIIKYTSFPSVSVPALINNFYSNNVFVGLYNQEDKVDQVLNENGEIVLQTSIKRDGTERVYSYCFEVRDKNNNIFATSGIQLHNSEKDISTVFSSDEWKMKKEMQPNELYYLTYKVTTMNGLECSSARYLILNQEYVDAYIPFDLQATLDFDDACIKLDLNSTNKIPVVINGNYILTRSSSLDNYTTWDEIHRFAYNNFKVEDKTTYPLWEDFAIQQGVSYKYALQIYNSFGLHSHRLLSNEGIGLYVDFEDCFLYDGERQLKIRFNPKVSSFKTTVLESKMDTIGGKHPFVFRNGNVNYKEFPISGLISLVSDPNERFMKGIQTGNLTALRTDTPALEPPDKVEGMLTADNIQREREFKLAVLDWLNNGKPKLFKSPAEGNYIVRLMNISLSPNDTLSRMLHTFSCTAYEVSDYNFDNLVNLKLLTLPNTNANSLRIGQVNLKELIATKNESDLLFADKYPDFSVMGNIINLPSVFHANITEATPGTIIGLNFANGQGVVSIEIGGTGAYYIQTNEAPLISISLISGNWDGAKFTFNYYDDTPVNSFSKVAKLTISDEIRQFIGVGYDTNIITAPQFNLQDVRRELKDFHYIKIMKRQIENMYLINGKYYRDNKGTDLIRDKEWNPVLIYHDVDRDIYYDGHKNKPMAAPPDYRFKLNSQEEKDYIDLTGRDRGDETIFGDTFGRVEAIRNITDVTELRVGTGVFIDAAYRVRVTEYVVENTELSVIRAKQDWLDAVAYVDAVIASPYMTQSIFEDAVKQAQKMYEIYLTKLNLELSKEV